MKNILFFSAFIVPLGIFAQGNTNTQIQNVNYYNQVNISNDNNSDDQQADPREQAQQRPSGNSFGSNENDHSGGKVYCKDCEAVKKALRAAHASSGSRQRGRSRALKRWSRKFFAETGIKMNKAFSRRYKVKTSYAICFNWH